MKNYFVRTCRYGVALFGLALLTTNPALAVCTVSGGQVTADCQNLTLSTSGNVSTMNHNISGSGQAAILGVNGGFGGLTVAGAPTTTISGGSYAGIELQSGSTGTLSLQGSSISGSTGVLVDSGATVTTLMTMSGVAISGSGSSTALGISNFGTITTLNNSSGVTITGGINNQSGGVITTLSNSGTVDGSGNSSITNAGSIGTLTNRGSMFNGSGWSDINNTAAGATIGTLINSQGVGNTNGALKYAGALPTNYSIAISSTSSYGQLAVTSASGATAFGIAAGSNVSAHLYTAVISGISSGSSFSVSGGTYNGLSWSLTQEGSSGIWDLLVAAPAPSGPSAANTQSSLQLSANALRSVYALQTASITNGLTYDCNVFDKEGICVSAGGRYDRVNTGDTHASNGLLIGSYRVAANTRVGAWVDQNLSASSATGVNLNNGQPMFGVFGVWNANQSGNGFEARLSAGYGDKDLTATRQVVGTTQASEAGTGTTRLNTQGVSAVASYNFPVATDLTVSPYLGARYTRVNANGYTEATSSAVTTPLTFAALKQETTTAVAGLKVSARVSPECGVFGSVGAELDTNNQGNNYSATGVTGLTTIALNPDTKRLRGVASVGTYYDLDKTQRISLSAVYREEAFQSVNTLSTMATYTAGF